MMSEHSKAPMDCFKLGSDPNVRLTGTQVPSRFVQKLYLEKMEGKGKGTRKKKEKKKQEACNAQWYTIVFKYLPT